MLSRRKLIKAFIAAMTLAVVILTGLPGAETPLAAAWNIAGSITSGGAPLAGVTVNLTGAAAATTITDAAGNYLFTGLLDGAYTVTPSLGWSTFTPSSSAVNIAGADSPPVDFTATQALPGGTLDPTAIPKYVTPLVIPPVMKTTGVANTYDIAVRQFKQQILPASMGITPTTVWGYGPTADPLPTGGVAPAANSQFNYPSYTIETASATPVSVRWRNELVADPVACAASLTPATDPACNFIPHILPVDQTLHWANPSGTGCTMATTYGTDCHTNNPAPYAGPVPIVTHVHGAHVDAHSDGYPEAWWLPRANNIAGYVPQGSLFDDALGQARGLNLGYADYHYRNDQPAATIWYHDHSLGMTRLNVYAGPAGFWLIRGGANGDTFVDNSATPTPNDGVLPVPAPVAGQTVLQLNVPSDPVRRSIREIPIAIQDRSFNADGSLFYPSSRTFFDGYPGPFVGTGPSDIAPIWNPEAFFNTIVVNGATWPTFEVAPALYRLRLLNGCNSRFLNLSIFEVDPVTGVKGLEHPFYQIGAEQGFLPKVVHVQTGFATQLPGNGTVPNPLAPAPSVDQALLMGLAERADVIVDFRGLAGKTIRMFNTGPDAPFGGFPAAPVADPATTGQVMQFVVNAALDGASPTDPTGATPATDPTLLVLPAEAALPTTAITRNVSLNEMESAQVCVTVDPVTGAITSVTPQPAPVTNIAAVCAALNPPAIPMAPQAAMVGTVNLTNPAAPLGIPLAWTDMSGASTVQHITLGNGVMTMVPVTEKPVINNGVAPVEEWNIYNFTVDAHPIHLHLVRFQVINRAPIPGVVPAPTPFPQQAWETGYKDSVIAYPGEITTVRAKFDVAGLYVWHCHIVEHEDNEMMRPFYVTAAASISGTVTSGGAPLAGVTMTLTDPIAAVVGTTTSDATGNYTFTGVASGSYTVTPTLAGSTFVPLSANVTLSGTDITPVNFAATVPGAFNISGTVTYGGAPLAGVTVTLGGAAAATTTTDALGNYFFTGLANGSYTVIPSLVGITFLPTVANVTVAGADVTPVNFGSGGAGTFGISGTVTSGGVPVPGVTVNLTGAATATTTTDAAGNYFFTGLANGAYVVTPSLAGYVFTPPSTNVTINNADVGLVDATGTFPVTASAGANGSLDAATPSPVDVTYGGTAHFQFEASPNYHVATVTGCGLNYSNSSNSVTEYLATTPPLYAPCSVSATFSINRFTVTAAAGANGTLSASTPSPVTVDYGLTATFTFNANANYHVASVSGCGINFTNVNESVTSYTGTTSAVTADCTVSATFAVSAHTIASAVTGSGGAISCVPSVVLHGGSSVCTVTPSNGFTIQILTDNGADVTASLVSNSYTISNVLEDHAVLATFRSIADFTATPLVDGAPMVVSFTDLSVNNPTSWLWDFGDGSTSTLQNPVHWYMSEGSYTVSLTASDGVTPRSTVKTNYIMATACVNQPVSQGAGASYFPYPTIQSAYDVCGLGEEIRAVAKTFTENLTFGSNAAVVFRGGYDCLFSGNASAHTTVAGTVTIGGPGSDPGTVTIENLTIR